MWKFLLPYYMAMGPHIVFDNLGPIEPTPQLGVYGEGYPMTDYALLVKGQGLVDIMPQEVIAALADSECGITDRKQLKARMAEQKQKSDEAKNTHISFIIMTGSKLAKGAFNVVFHPILVSWLNKLEAKDFHAGVFAGNGIGPAAEGIAINKLGGLNVNPHPVEKEPSIVAYSPNNGRLAFTDGRKVATFWLVGCWGGRVVISYIMLTLDKDVDSYMRDNLSAIRVIPEYKPGERMAYALGILEKVPGLTADADKEAVKKVIEQLKKAFPAPADDKEERDLQEAIRRSKLEAEKNKSQADKDLDEAIQRSLKDVRSSGDLRAIQRALAAEKRLKEQQEAAAQAAQNLALLSAELQALAAAAPGQ